VRFCRGEDWPAPRCSRQRRTPLAGVKAAPVFRENTLCMSPLSIFISRVRREFAVERAVLSGPEFGQVDVIVEDTIPEKPNSRL